MCQQFQGFWAAFEPTYQGRAAIVWVLMGARVPMLSQMMTLTIPRPTQGLLEKNQSFEIFQVPLNQQFQELQTAHGPSHKGLAATVWIPMGARVPILSPNDDPNPSHNPQNGFGKNQNFEDREGNQPVCHLGKGGQEEPRGGHGAGEGQAGEEGDDGGGNGAIGGEEVRVQVCRMCTFRAGGQGGPAKGAAVKADVWGVRRGRWLKEEGAAQGGVRGPKAE